MEKNVEKLEGYDQVCVWPGTYLEEKDVEKFESFFKDAFQTRVQFLEQIETFPSTDDNGNDIEGTGGRTDIFFAVHNDDVLKFAVKRLELGIRWIEDVLDPSNYQSKIYPDRVYNYCS